MDIFVFFEYKLVLWTYKINGGIYPPPLLLFVYIFLMHDGGNELLCLWTQSVIYRRYDAIIVMSISLSNALCLERARNRLTCCSCVACHGEVECTHPSVSLVICYRDPLSCLDHFFCRQYVTVDHYIMKYGCHLWNPVFFHNKILVLTLWVTSR